MDPQLSLIIHIIYLSAICFHKMIWNMKYYKFLTYNYFGVKLIIILRIETLYHEPSKHFDSYVSESMLSQAFLISA